MEREIIYVIAHFGGGQEKEELFPFIQNILTGHKLTPIKWLPMWLQRYLLTKLAKRKSQKMAAEYGPSDRSPTGDDQQALSHFLKRNLSREVLSFYPYNTATHQECFQKMEATLAKEIRILSCFPQFSYKTTGYMAKLLSEHLSPPTLNKIRWIKSFPGHPAFIEAFTSTLQTFLERKHLSLSSTYFIFSAQGIPNSSIDQSDLYQSECEMSYRKMTRALGTRHAILSYQSKFSQGRWLEPSTTFICKTIANFAEDKKQVVFVPFSAVADSYIMTREIKTICFPLVEKQGYQAHLCPALNLHPKWTQALLEILQETNLTNNQMLIPK